jgi:sugar phosphate isomerase/epimerase
MVAPVFSLAHLTVLGLSPPEVVRVASRTGYKTVGLRLIRITEETPGYPLMRDRKMMAATKAAMDETGVGVLDIEFVRISPDINVADLEPFISAGTELKARYVITAPYDPDLGRFADRLAAVEDLAVRYGLHAVLEFFPWTVVPNLSAALAVVEATGQPGIGILVDTLHFNRSNSSVEQLAHSPKARLPFVHVADAPVQESYTTDELLTTARAERLPPGEGGIDIRGILDHMPEPLPIALEVPMTRLTAADGAEAVALRVRSAASRLLGRAPNAAKLRPRFGRPAVPKPELITGR